MKRLAWVALVIVPFGIPILGCIALRELWRWLRTDPAEEALAYRMRREECRLGALADLPEPRGMATEKQRRRIERTPHGESSYDREVSR